MAEYGSARIAERQIVKRTPPLVVFGITFGESSYLDYDPDTKLKVNQNDLLVFFRQMAVMLKSGVPLAQGLELLAENMTNKNKNNKINKVNQLRIESNSNESLKQRDDIFEFVLLEIITKLLKHKKNDSHRWCYYYYTLCKLSNYEILKI